MFNIVWINKLIIVLDKKLNSWVINYFQSYQLTLTLVIYNILEICYNEFYK